VEVTRNPPARTWRDNGFHGECPKNFEAPRRGCRSERKEQKRNKRSGKLKLGSGTQESKAREQRTTGNGRFRFSSRRCLSNVRSMSKFSFLLSRESPFWSLPSLDISGSLDLMRKPTSLRRRPGLPSCRSYEHISSSCHSPKQLYRINNRHMRTLPKSQSTHHPHHSQQYGPHGTSTLWHDVHTPDHSLPRPFASLSLIFPNYVHPTPTRTCIQLLSARLDQGSSAYLFQGRVKVCLPPLSSCSANTI
jgi:hypothetical protein